MSLRNVSSLLVSLYRLLEKQNTYTTIPSFGEETGMLQSYPLNITPESLPERAERLNGLKLQRAMLELLRKQSRLLQSMEKQLFVRLHLKFPEVLRDFEILDCAQLRRIYMSMPVIPINKPLEA